MGAGQSNWKREQRECKNRKETGKQEEKGKRGEEDQSRQKLKEEEMLEHFERFWCSTMTCLHGAEERNLHL
jgi:hypothetical protein